MTDQSSSQITEQRTDTVNESLSHAEDTKEKNKKKKWSKLNLICLLVAIGIGGGYFIYQYQQTQATAAYKSKVELYQIEFATAYMAILKSAANAETICNEYSDIWSKAIKAGSRGITVNYKQAYDFNDALNYKGEELSSKIKDMKSLMKTVEDQMKIINTPMAEFQKPYEVLLQAYSLVSEYAALAESPKGSLTSFNQKTEQVSGDIMKRYNELKVLTPDLNNLGNKK